MKHTMTIEAVHSETELQSDSREELQMLARVYVLETIDIYNECLDDVRDHILYSRKMNLKQLESAIDSRFCDLSITLDDECIFYSASSV